MLEKRNDGSPWDYLLWFFFFLYFWKEYSIEELDEVLYVLSVACLLLEESSPLIVDYARVVKRGK